MFFHVSLKFLSADLFSAMLVFTVACELSLVVVRELLIAVLQSVDSGAHWLSSFSLRTPEHRLMAQLPGSCEIFLDSGSNLCPLHCKADS